MRLSLFLVSAALALGASVAAAHVEAVADSAPRVRPLFDFNPHINLAQSVSERRAPDVKPHINARSTAEEMAVPVIRPHLNLDSSSAGNTRAPELDVRINPTTGL